MSQAQVACENAASSQPSATVNDEKKEETRDAEQPGQQLEPTATQEIQESSDIATSRSSSSNSAGVSAEQQDDMSSAVREIFAKVDTNRRVKWEGLVHKLLCSVRGKKNVSVISPNTLAYEGYSVRYGNSIKVYKHCIAQVGTSQQSTYADSTYYATFCYTLDEPQGGESGYNVRDIELKVRYAKKGVSRTYPPSAARGRTAQGESAYDILRFNALTEPEEQPEASRVSSWKAAETLRIDDENTYKSLLRDACTYESTEYEHAEKMSFGPLEKITLFAADTLSNKHTHRAPVLTELVELSHMHTPVMQHGLDGAHSTPSGDSGTLEGHRVYAIHGASHAMVHAFIQSNEPPYFGDVIMPKIAEVALGTRLVRKDFRLDAFLSKCVSDGDTSAQSHRFKVYANTASRKARSAGAKSPQESATKVGTSEQKEPTTETGQPQEETPGTQAHTDPDSGGSTTATTEQKESAVAGDVTSTGTPVAGESAAAPSDWYIVVSNLHCALTPHSAGPAEPLSAEIVQQLREKVGEFVVEEVSYGAGPWHTFFQNFVGHRPAAPDSDGKGSGLDDAGSETTPNKVSKVIKVEVQDADGQQISSKDIDISSDDALGSLRSLLSWNASITNDILLGTTVEINARSADKKIPGFTVICSNGATHRIQSSIKEQTLQLKGITFNGQYNKTISTVIGVCRNLVLEHKISDTDTCLQNISVSYTVGFHQKGNGQACLRVSQAGFDAYVEDASKPGTDTMIHQTPTRGSLSKGIAIHGGKEEQSFIPPSRPPINEITQVYLATLIAHYVYARGIRALFVKDSDMRLALESDDAREFYDNYTTTLEHGGVIGSGTGAALLPYGLKYEAGLQFTKNGGTCLRPSEENDLVLFLCKHLNATASSSESHTHSVLRIRGQPAGYRVKRYLYLDCNITEGTKSTKLPLHLCAEYDVLTHRDERIICNLRTGCKIEQDSQYTMVEYPAVVMSITERTPEKSASADATPASKAEEDLAASPAAEQQKTIETASTEHDTAGKARATESGYERLHAEDTCADPAPVTVTGTTEEFKAMEPTTEDGPKYTDTGTKQDITKQGWVGVTHHDTEDSTTLTPVARRESVADTTAKGYGETGAGEEDETREVTPTAEPDGDELTEKQQLWLVRIFWRVVAWFMAVVAWITAFVLKAWDACCSIRTRKQVDDTRGAAIESEERVRRSSTHSGGYEIASEYDILSNKAHHSRKNSEDEGSYLSGNNVDSSTDSKLHGASTHNHSEQSPSTVLQDSTATPELQRMQLSQYMRSMMHA
ncbi:hypothetical protein OC188_01620 [Anaplasma capra]|uniref:hypothetical protein n=1 Tax=Anaplasma capra TaxID=1562740 RepID=UPI0021D613A3|nr:hypothetical protein [Anaplasma capra]MCU7611398.1 hypothetical protein [Anaplasma capra]